MGRLIDTDDLIDASGVAEILGLSKSSNVNLYQRRYPDMPQPVVYFGPTRPSLWLRSEIEAWSAKRTDRRRAKKTLNTSTEES